jgi:segregation and condensation protein B
VTDNEPPTPDEPGSGPAPPPLGDGMSLATALEAVLFVVDAPVAVSALAAAFQRPGPDIEAGLISLQESLEARGSGLELRRVASGVRLYTRPDYAPWVTSFLLEGQRSRLSQAALETLAVIAYRQPVTRAKISAIRGVNVDSVVRTLTSRGLIAETETDPDTGGGLYCTTDLFLEKMGLRSLAELPSLAPMLPDVDTLDTDAL